MNNNQNIDELKIDANPTKEFFIFMLVRDISLRDAICDLIDNSIDGAKSLRGESGYKGLKIEIEINDNCFIIKDNCGGIDINVAKNYAFRFGRPTKVEQLDFSIGQFGIGMKRSLFKMGGAFSINSKTIQNSFHLDVDVQKWTEEENKDWQFQFKSFKENESRKEADTGTEIIVNDLYSDISNSFVDGSFLSDLKQQIEFQNLYNINKGILITLNGEKLNARQLNFNVSDEFKLGQVEANEDGVETTIYVGISEKKGDLGGWYIFCNDRLILGPEQTKISGWGDGLPKYHLQYDRFRGIVFFKSKNASKLPWNTTKTGLNEDSKVYKTAKQLMVESGKPVISFLNYLKSENDSDYAGSRILNSSVQATKVINFATSNVIQEHKSEDGKFDYPEPDNRKKVNEDEETTINAFKKNKKDVEKLKKFFSVKTNKEVGEHSFDYVLNNEF